MKNFNKLFASVVLTLLLSASTFATDGIIHTVFAEPVLPPASTTPNVTNNADGIITTGFTSADSATVVALNMLQSVLALF